MLHPILGWRDGLAIIRGPHTNISTRSTTRTPDFATRHIDHPPTPELPMFNVMPRWSVEPPLPSVEAHLRGDAREVLIIRVEGIPRQEVPEDLVRTGSSMLRCLSEEDHLNLRLAIELEDLEDGQPEVESLAVDAGLYEVPEICEAQMNPLEEPPLHPAKCGMVDGLEKPEGPLWIWLMPSLIFSRGWRSWRTSGLIIIRAIVIIPPIIRRSISHDTH